MRKSLPVIIIAALAALFVATFATAQPTPGFSKTAPIAGTGSSGAPLKITACANGEDYVSNGTTWVCTTAGDITSVGATASMGLTGGAASGAALLGLLSTCGDGQVLKSGASGTTWTCGDDTGTTYTAGDGLTLTANDFDLTYTSDFTITADQLNLSTAVTAPGAFDVAGHTTLGDAAGDVVDINGDLTKFGNTSSDGATYINDNQINWAYSTNGAANAFINYLGYAGGSTQYRDLYFADGRTGVIAHFDGETKAVALAGAVAVDGNTTLGDAASDTTSTVGTVSVTSTAAAQSASRTLVSVADSGTFTTAAADRVAIGIDSLSTNTVSTGTNTLYSVAIRGRANTDTSTNFETAIGVYGSAVGTNSFAVGVYASASGTNSYSLFTEDRPVVFSDSMLHSFGTAPAPSSCGGSPTVTGTNQAGKIVTGSGATGCILTFASPAWISSDVTCVVSARGGTAPSYTPAATTLTLNTAAASATYDYWCTATSNGTSITIP